MTKEIQMTKVRTVNDFVPEELRGTPAGDVIRRNTAVFRHADRITATQEAAQNETEHLDWEPEAREAAQSLLMIADYIGRGSNPKRHDAFAELGDGRRFALAGAAYMSAELAAIKSAGWQLTVSTEEPYLPCIKMTAFDDTVVLFTAGMVREVLGTVWAEGLAEELLRMSCRSDYKPHIFEQRVLTERPLLDAVSAFYNQFQ